MKFGFCGDLKLAAIAAQAGYDYAEGDQGLSVTCFTNHTPKRLYVYYAKALYSRFSITIINIPDIR